VSGHCEQQDLFRWVRPNHASKTTEKNFFRFFFLFLSETGSQEGCGTGNIQFIFLRYYPGYQVVYSLDRGNANKTERCLWNIHAYTHTHTHTYTETRIRGCDMYFLHWGWCNIPQALQENICVRIFYMSSNHVKKYSDERKARHQNFRGCVTRIPPFTKNNNFLITRVCCFTCIICNCVSYT
jgi:hypothetical protein